MTEIQIDKRRALALLDQAVAQRGEDFVYVDPAGNIGWAATCKYAHGDEPGCLIGLALFLAGVPVDVLNGMDCPSINPDGTGIGQAADRAEGVTLTDDALRIFEAAQSAQDSGLTWGEAVKAGREAAE